MHRSFAWAFALALAALPCLADRVVLKSGAEITGVITLEERSDTPAPGTLVSVTVALRGGAIVVIKGEDIALIDRDDKTRWQEYEERSEQAADDPEARLALAEWCRQRGMPKEAAEECLRVLVLSPENPRAEELLRKLGWKQVAKENGELCWITPEEARKREQVVRHEKPPDASPPPSPAPAPQGQVVDGGDMKLGGENQDFARWRLPGGGKKADEETRYGWGRYAFMRWFEPKRPPKKDK